MCLASQSRFSGSPARAPAPAPPAPPPLGPPRTTALRKSRTATSAATTHRAVPTTSESAKIPFCDAGEEQNEVSKSVDGSNLAAAATASQTPCAAKMITRCAATLRPAATCLTAHARCAAIHPPPPPPPPSVPPAATDFANLAADREPHHADHHVINAVAANHAAAQCSNTRNADNAASSSPPPPLPPPPPLLQFDQSTAAVMIQSRYRGNSARRKQTDAEMKIQALHRGRSARRDEDLRSNSTKQADGAALRSDLEEMNARMKKMSRAMDEHEEKQDKELLRCAVADGGG